MREYKVRYNLGEYSCIVGTLREAWRSFRSSEEVSLSKEEEDYVKIMEEDYPELAVK